MTTTAPDDRDARRRLACAAIGATLLLALAGCASTPAGEAGGSRDIVTESDETEARKRARIRMELAIGYFEQGKTNVALDELKQVIASDPTYPDAYNLRGLIYMRLNDFGQAEESFRRAVALNPRDSNAQHNYGWLLCQQGRYDDAQRAFDAALSNNQYGDGAKTLMTQGLCQAKAGRMAAAFGWSDGESRRSAVASAKAQDTGLRGSRATPAAAPSRPDRSGRAAAASPRCSRS